MVLPHLRLTVWKAVGVYYNLKVEVYWEGRRLGDRLGIVKLRLPEKKLGCVVKIPPECLV